MDSRTIHKICTDVSILKDKFLGVVRLRDLLTVRENNETCLRLAKTGQFFIVNVENVHWIAFLWIDPNRMFVFDSLGLTDNKTMKQTISFVFGVQNVKFLHAKNNYIQSSDSLTCGEHVVYFCLYQTLFDKVNKHFDEEYIKNLKQFCINSNISTDLFVWLEIYDKMKLAQVPDLHEIINWERQQVQ